MHERYQIAFLGSIGFVTGNFGGALIAGSRQIAVRLSSPKTSPDFSNPDRDGCRIIAVLRSQIREITDETRPNIRALAGNGGLGAIVPRAVP